VFEEPPAGDLSDEDDEIPDELNDIVVEEFLDLLLSCLNLTDPFAFLDPPDVPDFSQQIDPRDWEPQFDLAPTFKEDVKAVGEIFRGIAPRRRGELTWEAAAEFGRRQVIGAPDSRRRLEEQAPGPVRLLGWHDTNPFERRIC
jgi:hypothetical protein